MGLRQQKNWGLGRRHICIPLGSCLSLALAGFLTFWRSRGHYQRQQPLLPTPPLLQLQSALESWIDRVPDLVARLEPAAVPSASEGKPFVFFHVRKAGGSTLRAIIARAAAARNLTRWIPCYSSVSCHTYSLLPNNVLRDVYGSHVNYADVMKLTIELAMETKKREDLESTVRVVRPRENGGESKTGEDAEKEGEAATIVHTLPEEEKRDNFDCLANLRSTVSRVVSCWNFRMNDDAGGAWDRIPPASELSAGDWSALLPVAYGRYMGGCNNEIGRIFGDKIDEREMNTLSPSNPLFLHELNTIASRMAKCVIIVPERCEESIAVMRHYLPWMDGADELCEKKLNRGNLEGSPKELTTNSSDAILAQNQLDDLLFQLGEALFEKQHEIAMEKGS